jgi:rRNA-processing protein FCF1
LKVVLDTTVFENGFNSRSAEVQLLKTFLAQGKSELCIPSVVYEEAVNRVRKRMREVNSKIDALHRLTRGEDATRKIEVDEALKNYGESLSGLLQTLKARFLP